jgi:hypothetical protein
VLGGSDGGVLDEDLHAAALRALEVPRERALARARTFDWHAVCEQFIGHLVSVSSARPGTVTKGSQNLHKLGT